MNNKIWPVVPICDKQLRDVKHTDILFGGLFRKCDVYESGGGYDKFPDIYQKMTNMSKNFAKEQFVVQLSGCPLNCPYCYVTPDGINGYPHWKTTNELLNYFFKTKCNVFHLMGGAPALYLEYWKELHDQVNVFHSDFLLVEKFYKKEWLQGLLGLHAVSVKDPLLYTKDQRVLFFSNLIQLIRYNVKFYVTFTDVPDYWKNEVLHYLNGKYEYFDIDIIKYKALDA